MAEEYSGKVRRNSNAQLLEELEALSQSLYQSHTSTTNRRTASLALPRTSIPPISSAEDELTTPSAKVETSLNKPRSRRMSLSPWRSRLKLEELNDQKDTTKATPDHTEANKSDGIQTSSKEKKGIWNWKPMRALSHMGMQKLSCLFSVEVVSIQGLPSSMNGLRLSVRVRKKETNDGAVQTMPSRVSQGTVDFEETLFVRCHVYCSTSGKQIKFEPRMFWIYAFAADAHELDFGKGSVDLSQMIQESIEKSNEGTRVRSWDKSFNLSGKAKRAELVLKLGFQIMEKDGGIGIYSNNQGEDLKSGKSKIFNLSSSLARKQSKTSFSVPSPRLTNLKDGRTPSSTGTAGELQGIDDLNLDEPGPAPAPSPPPSFSNPPFGKKLELPDTKQDDLDLPEFEVVDKGVEMEDKDEDGGEDSEKSVDTKSTASEVVKEIMFDMVHLTRLNKLDSIAQQIKALESMMGDQNNAIQIEEETESQRLDADEETVTREFLQMLEKEETKGFKFDDPELATMNFSEGGKGKGKDSAETESKVYLPDLGKGLGCVVQTRDGGYLASMNPLDTPVARKDTPKLAMQISKPFVISLRESISGFELFQKMASSGFDGLSSKILSLMSMDELNGKTAEQVAFEGIASAIIQGRNKEGASSSAARTIAAVKSMANAMSAGRKERISSGIWNVIENPLTPEEILAFSLQKIETMAVEALKIQAEMAEEDAPFDVSPFDDKGNYFPFDSAVSTEDWIKNYGESHLNSSGGDEEDRVALMMLVQLRDPIRRYEAVGGHMVVLVLASGEESKGEEERRFKVKSLHVGGFKIRTGGKRSLWDGEKQRLTAMQWLVAYGLGKGGGKKGKSAYVKGQDLLWSISSRIMADMWLKSMRNPDVKFSK